MTVYAKSDSNRYRLNVKLFVVLICSMLMAACTVPTLVVFTNASTQSITLSYKGEDRQLVSLVVIPNGKVEIKRLLDMHFSIRRQDLNFEYDVEMVPEAFIEHVGAGPFFKRVAKAQLEDDGCIYLIAIKDDQSRHVHPVQPEGFPLCPTKR
ncbi:MAG: hypothetical protein JWQ01_300 [Massilia sp.]|nr:hypothetical protein [Massilia sp.]